MGANKVTYSTFEQDVLKNEKTVLLDFWASWCGPCRMVAPVIEAIADENPEIFVGKINVDEEMQLASAFGVEAIPTLVVMREGKFVNRVAGALPKEKILEMVKG